MSNEAIVTIPPDVVRILASSTVFVKASSRVKRFLAGMVAWYVRSIRGNTVDNCRSQQGLASRALRGRDQDSDGRHVDCRLSFLKRAVGSVSVHHLVFEYSIRKWISFSKSH